MRSLTLTPNEAQKHGIAIRLDGVRRDALSLLTLPNVDFQTISAIWPELQGISAPIREQLEIDAQYAGYLDRQDADILAFRRDEGRALPEDLDYAAVHGLSTEIRQKLRPDPARDPWPGRPHRWRDARPRSPSFSRMSGQVPGASPDAV